jgi:uncharacterized protein YggE
MTQRLRVNWLPLAMPVAVAVAVLPLQPPVAAASVQVQLNCAGTVLEARGSATLKRAIASLRLSLSLEAEAPTAQAALALLQQRLDPVRSGLQALNVNALRVSSPSVWNRAVPPGRPAVAQASLQVSGELAPAQLQNLISRVGGLPGVRLAPVDPQADRGADAASNRQLLQAAYQDALRRGQDLAAALGLTTLRPLQVQSDGGLRPEPMVAMARSAPAPFDPRELPEPTDRLSLTVTFCARP